MTENTRTVTAIRAAFVVAVCLLILTHCGGKKSKGTGPGPVTKAGWMNVYGESHHFLGERTIATTDGGYLIAGEKVWFGASGLDVFLLKVDSLGETIWAREYANDRDDAVDALLPASDGGFFIVAHEGPFGEESSMHILRVDSLGVQKWRKEYSTAPTSQSASLCADGGIVVVGVGIPHGDDDSTYMAVHKVNSRGTLQWKYRLESPNPVFGGGIAEMDNGHFLVSGTEVVVVQALIRGMLVELDAEGKEVSQTSFGSGKYFILDQVLALGGDEYVIAGETREANASDWDYFLTRITGSRVTKWETIYNSGRSDELITISGDEGGGVLVFGFNEPFGGGPTLGQFLKLDNAGEEVWHHEFGTSPNDDWLTHGIPLMGGGYFLVGTSGSYGQGNAQIWMIRTDAEGNAPESPETRSAMLSAASVGAPGVNAAARRIRSILDRR